MEEAALQRDNGFTELDATLLQEAGVLHPSAIYSEETGGDSVRYVSAKFSQSPTRRTTR